MSVSTSYSMRAVILALLLTTLVPLPAAVQAYGASFIPGTAEPVSSRYGQRRMQPRQYEHYRYPHRRPRRHYRRPRHREYYSPRRPYQHHYRYTPKKKYHYYYGPRGKKHYYYHGPDGRRYKYDPRYKVPEHDRGRRDD